MLKVIMHGLLARKFRLVATALAVTLGVAFMAGTLVLTDTINHAYDGIAGTTRVLRVLSDTDNVDTQGPVWLVGGKTL